MLVVISENSFLIHTLGNRFVCGFVSFFFHFWFLPLPTCLVHSTREPCEWTTFTEHFMPPITNDHFPMQDFISYSPNRIATQHLEPAFLYEHFVQKKNQFTTHCFYNEEFVVCVFFFFFMKCDCTARRERTKKEKKIHQDNILRICKYVCWTNSYVRERACACA